jgi:peptidoglycan glycosyltransferase
MEKRIRRLGIFMVLCFAALFIQLNNIQVLKAHSLATSSENPAVVLAEQTQPRGEILASDGTVLAQSVLAPAADTYKYRRVYPAATAGLFANIVGWDSINYGRLGVEASYNQYLEAHNRTPKTIRDLLTNSTVTDNVTLTIQPKLQAVMANALNNIPQTGVSSPVSAVALDPTTGDILAAYSTPTYDPNPLVSEDIPTETAAYQADIHAPGNPILAKAYADTNAPGSTFKVVTSSAVYDHQPALANFDYPSVSFIPLPNSDKTLQNYQGESCGGTLQDTLPQSCDTAFAQMGMSLGAVSMNAEAQAFGFNQVPPLDLPGAVKSNFPSVADLANNQPAQAYSAFGQQNVTASALQMALVAAGIANGGVIETPHVMAQIRDSQGNLVTSYAPKPWLKATSTQTAQQVTSLMQGVVTKGTASNPPVFPTDENVAAKTGTAEVGAKAQYTTDWMIAFVPGSHVVVALVAPFQAGSQTGAAISGPPTCTILEAALNPNAPEACPGT